MFHFVEVIDETVDFGFKVDYENRPAFLLRENFP